jgi:hypothetical protein
VRSCFCPFARDIQSTNQLYHSHAQALRANLQQIKPFRKGKAGVRHTIKPPNLDTTRTDTILMAVAGFGLAAKQSGAGYDLSVIYQFWVGRLYCRRLFRVAVCLQASLAPLSCLAAMARGIE